MKHILLIICLLPFAACGVERNELDKMLSSAATNQGSAYLAVRNEITALGTNALPMLEQTGCDAKVSWQQRLVARICYERLARGKDIEALRVYNWRTHPKYDADWNKYITGPSMKLWQIAIPRFIEVGLWYYYIELTWKNTKEAAITKDKRLIEEWPGWCRQALDGQPEAVSLPLIMGERLKNDPALEQRDSREIYKETLRRGNSDAVPVLVSLYEAYNKREVNSLEMYHGENAKIFANEFNPVFAAADSRHAELLEKFVAEHPALADLKPRLAEVRARPAPTAKREPLFRLGTNIVTIAP